MKGCYGHKTNDTRSFGNSQTPTYYMHMYVGKECAMNMQLVSGQHYAVPWLCVK